MWLESDFRKRTGKFAPESRCCAESFATMMLTQVRRVLDNQSFSFVWSDKCDMPLGIETRQIHNQVMRSSSFYNYYCGPWNARLNQRRAGRNGGAWCAKRRDRAQWLQVDFGGLTRVRRITTEGRQNSDQWVTSYYLSYSKNGQRFTPFRERRRTKVLK